ncbi:MAG TPA: hypothetical protein VK447_03665, partial [Myxococcaceae bacterium]|nr:hypothetical protein [Myxococcaceae bacterium]
CALSITPGGIDFGTVPPKAGAVLGIRVENHGTDVCAVKNIQVADGKTWFSLPGGDIDGLVLPPGNFFTFMVAFRSPEGGGRYFGAVQIESADINNPRFLVPLVANSQASCLVATPAYLDFGRARPDCPVPSLSVNLLNACAQPVQLNRVFVGTGTADGEFELEGTSKSLPRELAPGEAVSVKVHYYGLVHGMNLSPLYVDASGLDRPLLVSLLGESSNKLDQVDQFTQQDGSKVDVLFVVDNTESMLEEQPKLISALPAFAEEVLARGVDLHVAFTTTGIEAASASCPGGARGGEAGRFFPVDNSAPRILTHRTPDLASALQRNANVGRCAFVEQGMEAVRRALSDPLVNRADDARTPLPNDGNLGFLRDEAGLAVVFVGDEDDHSPDEVDAYVRFLRAKKGANQPQRVVAYAIAPTEQTCSTAGGTGTRYAEVARRTGGEVMSICADNYAPTLRDLARKAFSPQDRFTLSARPVEGTLRVRVNGAELLSGWSYDAAQNAVVFSTRPAAGAKIELRYRKACEQ